MLIGGVSTVDVALLIDRLALGTFFAISGYHKLFSEERHKLLFATLAQARIPYISFNQWWVPMIEFLGGLALLGGVLTPLASLGLLVIMLVACCVTGKQRVASYKPIDGADFVDDWLYLQEVLYSVMLLMLICCGAGKFSIDAWF